MGNVFSKGGTMAAPLYMEKVLRGAAWRGASFVTGEVRGAPYLTSRKHLASTSPPSILSEGFACKHMDWPIIHLSILSPRSSHTLLYFVMPAAVCSKR